MDVSVSKNRKSWAISTGFQILSNKKNEEKIKWRWMQSGANHALGDTPANRENFREFAHFALDSREKNRANTVS